MPLFLPSSTGMDDTRFGDTLHGKPGDALPPQQSSARNRASGSIAGLPSRPYNARNASACSCCVAAHGRTPCQLGMIANHLPPRPTQPPTQRSSVIPSGIVVCRYHKGGGHDKTIILVVARVKGIDTVRPLCMPLLGYTDCCGSIGFFCWGRKVKIYTLPPSSLCCHSHPTRLPFHVSTDPVRAVRALLACMNAGEVRTNARMARFHADLGEHVRFSGRPVS
jgi:hypothetical protein